MAPAGDDIERNDADATERRACVAGAWHSSTNATRFKWLSQSLYPSRPPVLDGREGDAPHGEAQVDDLHDGYRLPPRMAGADDGDVRLPCGL
jgi:hypothetical protein